MLTNNPVKLEGLAKSGIEVVGRMPLEAPVNSDNYRYLSAKVTRAGHLLDHRLPPLAESSDAYASGSTRLNFLTWPQAGM